MNEEKYITLVGTIQKKKGITQLPVAIQFKVICKDQYSVGMFSDKHLAKQIAKLGGKKGQDIRYDSNLNVVVQRFEGMTAKEVATIIGKEMKDAGGTLQ